MYFGLKETDSYYGTGTFERLSETPENIDTSLHVYSNAAAAAATTTTTTTTTIQWTPSNPATLGTNQSVLSLISGWTGMCSFGTVKVA